MAGAKLEKTRWPGIYRRGRKFVYEWTDAHGQRRRATADTRERASALKADEEAKAARGDLGDHGPRGRLTLAAYAAELYGADVDRPHGTTPGRGRYIGRRGAVRDSTRDDYRRDIERYWLPTLGAKPLGKITPRDVSRVLAALAARDGDRTAPFAERYLSDRTLHRLTAPFSALLAEAVEEGLLATNPARDVKVPSGRDALRNFDADDADHDDPVPGRARALSRAQLDTFLLVVDPSWKLFFQLLASTGLRISEAIALRWTDLRLDGSQPVVRVRRAYVRGVFGPPKSRHGRRDIPLSHTLVHQLRERRTHAEQSADTDPVFPSRKGTPMDITNLTSRTLKPAVEEAGAPWAGFHAFRHFCASALINEGRNIVQVSRWLGHHSPSFTLDVYAHLMDEGVGQPLEISVTARRIAHPADSGTRERAAVPAMQRAA